MPRPGRQPGNTPFNTACDRLKRLTNRVYSGNLRQTDACCAMIDEFEILVDTDAYVPTDYNPYQALADRLKQEYPEVWKGDEYARGHELLSRWGAS